VPESVFATLSTEPYALRLSPRVEDYAVVAETKQTLPLIGADFLGEGGRYLQERAETTPAGEAKKSAEEPLREMQEPTSIWVGSSLRKQSGDKLEVLINDATLMCTVRGVYPDSNGNESAILMDI